MKKKISRLFRNKQALAAGFMMLLMVFSALAVVTDFFSSKENEPQFLGAYRGIDVYKQAEKDYYADFGQVIWHFRANPLNAANVSITYETKYKIQMLRNGPGYKDIFWNESYDKVYILLDPESNANFTLAAMEVSKALGAMAWFPETYFTEKSEKRPDIPVLTIEDAVQIDDSVIFYFEPSEDTRIKSVGRLVSLGAPTSEELDRAATYAAMLILGWS